jgi:beta-galactosidase
VRNVFNGLCLAIVQAGKEAGTIQVEASAEGLQSAKVEIQAEPTKLRPAVA